MPPPKGDCAFGRGLFRMGKRTELVADWQQKTCDGLAYSLNQEKQLRMFLRDGEIPVDNSASERTIRPFTVGRKNWMMLNTPRGTIQCNSIQHCRNSQGQSVKVV